jgi:hypothetical protein
LQPGFYFLLFYLIYCFYCFSHLMTCLKSKR